MSDKQKEAAAACALGGCYEKIARVFGAMPDRFKMLDLMRESGIKDCPQIRGGIGIILERDFKCVNVCTGGVRVWKKPGAKA